jgi:O-antigen ligase
MNISIKYFIKHREATFCIISALVLCSFTLSYAVNNIALFFLIPFFFLDTKENINLKFHTIKSNKVTLIFMLFFAVQCIGYFYSQDKSFALRRIEVMLPLLFAPAIIFTESITFKNANKLLSFLKYAIVTTFVLLLLSHVFILKRTTSVFVHFTVEDQLGISQFYLAFIVMLPILITLKAILEKQQLITNTILLSVSIGILLLLGNKTSLFFVVLLGITYTVLLIIRKQNKKALFLLGISIISIVTASQTEIVKNRLEVFVKTTNLDLETIITKNKYTETKNTFEHRLLINYLASKEIIKALPFGVGTGDFQSVLNTQYKNVNFKRGISGQLNNHNQYLSEFLKTGILGGFTFLFLLFLLFKKINKKQFFYPVFLSFFIIACSFESYLFRQHGVIIFAFIIPFLYKIDELNNIDNNI